MGKSLNGKELGKGISQRKDGRYQARFVNRFGKREIKEEELFLKEAEKSFYYNLFVVGLETGLRIGELMGLTWSDIDLKRKALYVRHTLTYFRKDGKYSFEWHAPKTKNSRRRIPLTKRACEALERQRVKKLEIEQKGQSAPKGYENLVFVTKNNNPTQQFIVEESICACLGRIQKEYPEFESFSPHTLRHTFATRAIENGMKPTSLQKLMGHASIKTTMDLYCHVTDDTLYDEMQLMEKVV